jgi:prepilin-type N-terminal cleavage/methylation domain-containing protein
LVTDTARGFSLTEFVVVVAILVLLAAAVLPAVGPLRRRSRLRTGAVTVSAALREARSLAITRSVACSVYVYAEAAPDLDEVHTYVGSASDPARVAVLPAGVDLVTYPLAGLLFSPDGSCPTSYLLTVRGDGKEEYEITVTAAGGSVKISRVVP